MPPAILDDDTALAASDRPIFVFAQHRGGGTLMLRLLNCHPDVVIWGEHGGFINQLAEAERVNNGYRAMMRTRPDAEYTRFLAGEEGSLADYSPWLSPMTVEDFSIGCRAMIRELFTRRIRPDQRWGFKEIRYHRPLVANFLARLFPGGRFVLLTRDPVELCVSNIMVSWSLDSLRAKQVKFDLVDLMEIVNDCLYAIVAMQTNMAAIQLALPAQTIAVSFDELAVAQAPQIERVLTFLGLAQTPETLEKMRIAGEKVAGATDKQRPAMADENLGLLTPDLVRALAGNLLPRVTKSIASHGIDLARLKRMGAQGRYSYLLGDVEAIEPGCSAIF